MDFGKELDRLAALYKSKGYEVIVRPGPGELPPFANDFKVEILGRRGAEGVLVAVKKNREEMAADKELARYADVTRKQTDWRFDFAILEGEEPRARDIKGAKELPDEDVRNSLADAEKLVGSGFVRPALVTAWAGFEAAMRRRLRVSGENTGWAVLPRQILADLYSAGVLSFEEFPRLGQIYRLRNETVHGFASPNLEASAVRFLADTARRLLDEAEPAKQPA